MENKPRLKYTTNRKKGKPDYAYIIKTCEVTGKPIPLKRLGAIGVRAAEDALTNYREQQRIKEVTPPPKIMFIIVYDEFLMRYKLESERKVSKETLRNFISMSRHFRNFFDCPILDIKYKDIERLKDHCIKVKLSPRSTNIVLLALKKVFKYAIKTEIIDRMPLIEFMRETRPEIKRATNGELQILLQNADPDMRFYILFLLYSGLRPKEFHELEWKNVNLDNFAIRVLSDNPNKKGGLIAIPMSLAAILEDRQNKTGFVSPYAHEHITTPPKRMRRLFKQCLSQGVTELERITPKTFRKTYLSRLSDSNIAESIMDHQGRNSAAVRQQSYLSPSHWAVAQIIDAAFSEFPIPEKN